jgi:lysophospholipase L1-like esterase
MKKLILIFLLLLTPSIASAALVWQWDMEESSWSGANSVLEEVASAHADPVADATTAARSDIFNSTYAGTFDGTGDYVDCNDLNNESFDTSASLSFWFYSDSWSGDVVMLGNNGETFTSNKRLTIQRYNVGDYPDALVMYIANDTGTMNTVHTDTFELSGSTWYHVVATWTAGTLKLYVDGTERGTLSPGTDYFPSEWIDFTLGRGVGIIYFQGDLDDVRIYDNVLSSGDVTTLYESYTINSATVTTSMDGLIEDFQREVSMDAIIIDVSSDLEYQWKMDEASWSGADDVIEEIGSYHGNAVSGATTADRDPDTKITTRWGTFDGTNDHVLFNDLDALSFPSSGSVACWFNATTANQFDPIWSNQGYTFSNANALRVVVDDAEGHLIFYTGDSGGTLNSCETTDFTVDTGVDYFMVATWTAGSIVLYINGEEVASDTPGTDRIPSAWDDFCAGRALSSYYYEGKMDDLRVYSRELSSSEVAYLYELYGFINVKKQVSMDAIVAAPTYDFVNIGDSIAWGAFCGTPAANCTTAFTIKCYLEDASGWSGINKGVSGESTTDILARWSTDAIDVDAEKIYTTMMTNDYYWNLSEATTLSNLNSMLSLSEAGTGTYPRELIIGEVPPVTSRAADPPQTTEKELIQEKTKKLNALARLFCLNNNLELGPTYWAMAYNNTTYEDDISSSPDYDDDGVHPECLGHEKMADNYYTYAAVPTRMWRWGIAADGVDDVSLAWWLLNGSSSVSGDADTGTLVIPEDDTVDSNVVYIEAGTKTITITNTVGSGTVNTYYRVSNYNFDRDDATDRNSETVSWVLYTEPVEIEEQFVQIRLEGESVADAQITDTKIEWTEGIAASSSGGVALLL